MNYSLLQIIVAARDGNAEDTGWTQMLILVMLAVFYAIGTILKARANKIKLKDQKQLARQPPEAAKLLQDEFPGQPRRPAGHTPRPQYHPAVYPPRRKVVRPQPAVRKFTGKVEHAIPHQTIELPEAPELSLPRPQLHADLKELPEFTQKPIKKLQDKYVAIPAEAPYPEPAIEPLLDYTDTDKLKRAILHYEILGKPLSLRDPSEHFIGL